MGRRSTVYLFTLGITVILRVRAALSLNDWGVLRFSETSKIRTHQLTMFFFDELTVYKDAPQDSHHFHNDDGCT